MSSRHRHQHGLRGSDRLTIGLDVGEGAKGPSGAVPRLLDVIAFGRLVDLRVKLLFRTGVTVGTAVLGLAVCRVAPLVALFHVRTGSGPVFVFLGRPAPVFVVVELGTGVPARGQGL